MFENVREDLRRACWGNQHESGVLPMVRELMSPGTQAVLVYRFGRWVNRFRVPGIWHVLRAIHFILQYFFGWRVGIFLPLRARIGPGLCIHTWGGGIFLPGCRIGRDLTVVGGGVLMDFNVREIGDEVVIGAGTKVMGKVRIGHGVRTGPNSVVQQDVPDGCVVVGNPGRILGPIPRSESKHVGSPRASAVPGGS